MESLNHKRVLSNFISRESEQKRFFSNDSLTPSGSEKSFNLRLDKLNTETSSSIPNTPQSTSRAGKRLQKPISLIIIEKYFTDICQSIANKGTIEKPLLSKAITMQEVLKDCLTAVPDISLQFYVLMASSLKEILEINSTQNETLYTALAKKIVQISEMIEENRFTSETDRANTHPTEEIIELTGLDAVSDELSLRITRVTARILNI